MVFFFGEDMKYLTIFAVCTFFMISCCESELRTRTDTDYIFFGQWPQSLKSENVSITTKSDIINGKTYYLGSDGEYYAKVENAQPYYDKVIFSNSENVVAGNTYYFKLEPIKWRILTGKNTSNALIFAEQIITQGYKFYPLKDSERYIEEGVGYLFHPRKIDGKDISPNNYEYSTVRAFLNGLDGTSYGVENFTDIGFYDLAFSDSEKARINKTIIDNSSISTTDYDKNGPQAYGFICNDTNDYLFLLSEYEITNPKYGFKKYDEEDENRRKKVCDYSRAIGGYVLMTDDNKYNGFGMYHLRSPVQAKANYCVRMINQYGDANRISEIMYQPIRPSVVPAMYIKMK